MNDKLWGRGAVGHWQVPFLHLIQLMLLSNSLWHRGFVWYNDLELGCREGHPGVCHTGEVCALPRSRPVGAGQDRTIEPILLLN